jgi:hypothetical protein
MTTRLGSAGEMLVTWLQLFVSECNWRHFSSNTTLELADTIIKGATNNQCKGPPNLKASSCRSRNPSMRTSGRNYDQNLCDNTYLGRHCFTQVRTSFVQKVQIGCCISLCSALSNVTSLYSPSTNAHHHVCTGFSSLERCSTRSVQIL